MCGLSGIIVSQHNGFTANNQNELASLMLLTQFRGADSTGVVSVSNKQEYSAIKCVGNPNNLWAHKEWEKWYADIYQRGKLVFTHGRAATRGTISEANAHPFVVEKKNKEGSIVFVHNGTLDNIQQLPGLRTFDVDSEWLAHSIAERGATETFTKVSGPIACMFWDSELKTFNVYRNIGRPLFIAQDTVTKSYYINSELEVLMYLKHRYNLNYTQDDVKTCAVEHLYTMDLKEPEKGWKKEEIKFVDGKPDDWDYQCGVSTDSKWNDHRASSRTYSRGAIVGSPAGYYSRPRGTQEDTMALIKGEFLEVEWDPRGVSSFMFDRITTLSNNTTITSAWCEPYEKHLIRLSIETEKNGDRFLTKEYYDPEKTTTWFTKTIIKPEVIALVAPVEEKKGKDKGPSVVNLAKGSKRVWKSKNRKGQKIVHKCTVSEQKEDMLVAYENNFDGEHKIGDTVNLEAYEFTQKSKGLTVIRFMKMQVNPNECVDYFGFVKASKEMAEHYDYYTGKILNMKVVSADEHAKYGYYVHIAVTDLEGHMFVTTDASVTSIQAHVNKSKLLN